MTVGELIELLKEQHPKSPVHFAYDYGDHWRTRVAPEVQDVRVGWVKHSLYHNMPKVVEIDEEKDEDEAAKEIRGAQEVIILS